MITNRSVARAAAPATSTASQAARQLMDIYDQSTDVKKPFSDEKETLPPDGVLGRDEFPSKRFDAIDALQTRDNRVSIGELEAAIAALPSDKQNAVLNDAKAARTQLTSTGKHFLAGFGGFALGGLALTGGLILSGPIGIGVAVLGGLGVLGGFGYAIKGMLDAGHAKAQLLSKLDGIWG